MAISKIKANSIAAGAIPEGVTKSATAPSSPSAGDIWWDTDDLIMYVYDGTSWVDMSNNFVATGGTITTATIGGTDYKIHTFTSSDTFTVQAGSKSVEYLVVGGGASGCNTGGTGSGGGGAGGYRSSVSGESSGGGASAETPLFVNPGFYTVTVGAGAAGATGGTGVNVVGIAGGDSTFASITSLGGGFPSPFGVDAAGDGGSGGGAGGRNGFDYTAGGNGTAGQGYDGGTCNTSAIDSSYDAGGGGGGAGGAGANGTNSAAGNGGVGVQSSINGTATYYAGGGGGGCDVSVPTAGTGGNGGGGNGGTSGNRGTDGATNKGGGAGGTGGNVITGANGGSGIVIIRYPI